VLGDEEIYFEGFVNTGDICTLNASPGDRLSADMNITIYDPRGQTNPADDGDQEALITKNIAKDRLPFYFAKKRRHRL
jgi:hypothetical protein